LTLLIVLVANLSYASEVSSHHQEQNREGGKTQNGKYIAGWARLLRSVMPTSVVVRLCRHGHWAP